jgi:hypothetical protein
MRLHTSLGGLQIAQALQRAKDRGHVGPGVIFAVDIEHRSRTHPRSFEIQLGSWHNDLPAHTFDQRGKRMRVRHTRQNHGWSGPRYAATWHEWGWFMREVFAMDPGARWGGDKSRSSRPVWGYSDLADFNRQTANVFARLNPDPWSEFTQPELPFETGHAPVERCSECGADLAIDAGEGYDGLCGSCADVAEKEGRWA